MVLIVCVFFQFEIGMSEGGDAKSSGTPIAELGVEQISALQRQVDQELSFFQESANQLKMYIRAELYDPDRMLVEMGTGYFAEVSREKARDFFERKKKYIAKQRLDGRTLSDFRQVKLVVGSECGTALCTMGETKVLCAVSASLTEPRTTRPNKGFITVDVDMSPMGNPAQEHNRLGERGLELTRMLELVLRDSRCIDVESLCVRAHKEVWKLRVDVRILDDDGGLLDCASVAAVAALYHFRRPNVTVQPNHTLIHSEYEQALVPLNIYHMPICVSFGFTKNGNAVVVDPTDKESQCLYGCLVIACNKRREVCALHQSTNLILSTSTVCTISTFQIEVCVKRAMQRAVDLSELISTVIRDDAQKRANYQKPAGFELTVNAQLLTTKEAQPNELVAPAVELMEEFLELEQPSIMINQNPLAGNNVSQFDESREEKAIASQVALIADGVDNVCMETTAPASSEVAAVSNRKREQDEVADLLDDLDNLDGETMELDPQGPLRSSGPEEEIDLLKARKKPAVFPDEDQKRL
ncbi:putative prefoldin, alpha subunit [Ostertagia ostertagi]